MARQTGIKVAVLAGATLMLESAFLRLLAVAQYYHFAFLVVSLALLGFGASGSILAVSSRLKKAPLSKILAWSGGGFVVSTGLAFQIINRLPFDSYSIAWDSRQSLFFLIYFLALALPFIFSGIGIGASLAAAGGESHLVYAANLLGSALGAAIGPIMVGLTGIPGAVIGSCLITLPTGFLSKRLQMVILVFGLGGLVYLGVLNVAGQAPLGLVISPYKGLAYARQYPGSQEIYRAWSAVSRVDVVAEAGTRQMPGLSYTYKGEIPNQVGISVDGDALQPVSLVSLKDFEAHAYLPEYIALELSQGTDLLVLNPGGGLGVLQGLASGFEHVTAVFGDSLIGKALEKIGGRHNPYIYNQVQVIYETPRVYLHRTEGMYDLVFVPLTDPYRPISSGAYSLSEDYLLTVEGVEKMLEALTPDGVLVITRWLQTPPSETVRMIALVREALRVLDSGDPADQVVAYSGIQTMTILVKPKGWEGIETERIREFLADRKFDLVWAPDIHDAEINQFNRLPSADYFLNIRDLLQSQDPDQYYDAYRFAITPPRDDHPFFFHFFTWQQTPDILQNFGKVWLPFGGSGFLLIFALLVLVVLLSVFLILLPLLLTNELRGTQVSVSVWGMTFLYFGSLGLGFLFIEIPLIQRWILLLGHPTYAFAVVVSNILLFSSLGSRVSRSGKISHRSTLGLVVLLAVITPFFVNWMIEQSLGWPLFLRMLVASLSLAPLAFALGLPFPIGMVWLESLNPSVLPWAWAVNGCASVIAAVVAALIGLEFGFSVVLGIGAALYAVAWLVSLAFVIPRTG